MSSTITMKNWAIKIADIEELPKHFKPGAEELLKYYKGESSIIYAPSKEHNDAVLILLEEEVVVLEKQEEVVTARFPMKEIQLVQMGTVLLDSWLKVCGKTGDSHQCVTVYFNTVMDALFEPVMQTLRRNMLRLADIKASIEAEQLDVLKDISLKFYNYGTSSLLPGQRVQAAIYQPGVKLSFWKMGSGRETEPHLLILTEEELLIVKETSERKKTTTQKYSGIWTHIPLGKIYTIDLAPLDDGWGELTIQLEGQKDLSFLYQADQMELAQQLVETLMAL